METGGGRSRQWRCGTKCTVASVIRKDGYGGGGDDGRATEEMRDDGDIVFGDDKLLWE